MPRHGRITYVKADAMEYWKEVLARYPGLKSSDLVSHLIVRFAEAAAQELAAGQEPMSEVVG